MIVRGWTTAEAETTERIDVIMVTIGNVESIVMIADWKEIQDESERESVPLQ